MPKEVTRTVFIANDGDEFASHDEALKHEIMTALYEMTYVDNYKAEKIAAYLMGAYILTPKPEPELLREDPDHGDPSIPLRPAMTGDGEFV